MLGYWTRIVAAWLILKIAEGVMKDAEHMLKVAVQSTPPLPPEGVAASPPEDEDDEA